MMIKSCPFHDAFSRTICGIKWYFWIQSASAWAANFDFDKCVIEAACLDLNIWLIAVCLTNKQQILVFYASQWWYWLTAGRFLLQQIKRKKIKFVEAMRHANWSSPDLKAKLTRCIASRMVTEFSQIECGRNVPQTHLQISLEAHIHKISSKLPRSEWTQRWTLSSFWNVVVRRSYTKMRLAWRFGNCKYFFDRFSCCPPLPFLVFTWLW